jgi:hypothetical protein
MRTHPCLWSFTGRGARQWAYRFGVILMVVPVTVIVVPSMVIAVTPVIVTVAVATAALAFGFGGSVAACDGLGQATMTRAAATITRPVIHPMTFLSLALSLAGT